MFPTLGGEHGSPRFPRGNSCSYWAPMRESQRRRGGFIVISRHRERAAARAEQGAFAAANGAQRSAAALTHGD